MKIMTGLLSLAALLLSSSQVMAQQVGTIGIGDVTYSAKNSSTVRSSQYVLNAFNNGISRKLANTRKFSVLGYSELTDRLKKQGRTLDGYYAKTYTGNAITQVGLDYILKADVTEFGLFKQKLSVGENAVGVLELDFELVGVADFTKGFSSSLSAQHTTKIQVSGETSAQEVLDAAIQRAVYQLVDQVISSLFPIRVMKIDDNGMVTLNYGAGWLEAGDTIFVYPADAEVVIDKSGNSIGDAVATLKVFTSDRKFAVAQAVNGYEGLEKGQKGKLLLKRG